MQPSNPIQLAQESLLNAGIINVVIIDRGAMIQAVQGALVADWDVGQPVTDQLYVLAGMEALIMAMADQGTAIDPIELPAVFLGGNHEDGDLGVSVRMSALDGAGVLLLLRPLEADGAVDQQAVQQHNDLALLGGQVAKSQTQAELNMTARETLFDTLRWGFRAPLSKLAQAAEGQEALASLAHDALHAVDDWLDLLSLRTQLEDEDGLPTEPIALASLMDGFRASFDGQISASDDSIAAASGRVLGSAAILSKGISSILWAAEGSLSLVFTVENASAVWTIRGVENGSALVADYRLELARSALMSLAGSVSVGDDRVVFSVPLKADA